MSGPISISSSSLRTGRLEKAEDLAKSWERLDLLLVEGSEGSRYVSGFACSKRCVEAALRLRFEVFNLELGEGLSSSVAAGLDKDEFDDHMSHLVLVERRSGNVVGTYRLQTMKHAALSPFGAYSAREFDLSPLEPIMDLSTECGRACLASDHRNARSLMQLWLGLGAYMNLHGQRYLFGCCSLTSTDPEEGWRALATLRRRGSLHDSILLRATPGFSCGVEPDLLDRLYPADLKLPKLFRVYLSLGAKVLSEPALDRAFGTVDFLVLIDAKHVGLSSLNVVL